MSQIHCQNFEQIPKISLHCDQINCYQYRQSGRVSLGLTGTMFMAVSSCFILAYFLKLVKGSSNYNPKMIELEARKNLKLLVKVLP